MMSDRRQVIIKVFRKYGHSLGPESLEFLEDLLDRHDIADEDVEFSMEWIAKEYNKQDDAQMKVSLEVLHRVYEAFQNGEGEGAQDQALLDPDHHMFVIDAFEMPLWNWSTERSTFERAPGPLTSSGSADSRVTAMRNRLNVIKQCVLRNDHFSPSTLPSKDRENLLTLRSTKQLLGRAGERFLLFGMLTHSKEGKLCLEDQDGLVELDFSQLDVPSEGLFTEGCLALVEGDYTEDATLLVIAIGHPPCESREAARSIFGHIDFLGKGATTLLEDKQFSARVQVELADLRFFILSDVCLDRPETLHGLRKLFDNCMENSFIPKLIVLCGNFTSIGIPQGNGREFFEQEIVIFREDLMSRMLRNLVGVKPDVKNDDLKRYLVQTILDQSHLMPLTTSIQPTLAEYDHALRLYPLPTAVVLADTYDRYQMTYEGCHVFNPGRFVGNSFTFSAYAPARRESEECVLDVDLDDGWS
ncbi:hypothetical protein ACG7TL_003838 [Trametes sanguinea]